MSKKMGRPKLARGEARAVIIAARFALAEAREIAAAAKQSGQPQTEWVRNSLLTTARSATV